MIYLKKPIAYLTNEDFDENNNLVNGKIPKDIPTIIMIQAKFCGYCTQAKPSFQDFADKFDGTGKIFTATIEADGDQSGEKELSTKIKKIDPSFRGYPHYIAYKNGKYFKTHNGGRLVSDLEKFVNSL